MNLDKYDCKANRTFSSFTFDSHGPKGCIKKVIDYKLMGTVLDGMPVYNISFGDWNAIEKRVDDLAISNNDDRDKVLATVASSVQLFFDANTHTAVFAQGATPAKTRLYQMGINAHRDEIERVFKVYGLLNNSWHLFEHGKNYEAFVVIRK